MDLMPTASEEAFRSAARAWLAVNVPDQPRPTEVSAAAAYDVAWQRKLFDHGWAGVSWPKEHGGLGLSLTEQVVWFEESTRARAPQPGANFIGLSHAGPTLIALASEEQKAHHLPRILRADSIWCQGFSEPNAGSDLAGLRTRAVVDGNELVVTGQKVWTSFAVHAQYQELLVRTSSEGDKHRGISWVIGDMRLPGIEIRPIVTMDQMAHFCEVFYNDVRIPIENVVGGLNNGWAVALANLGFERATALTAAQIELAQQVEDLIMLARETTDASGRALIEDDDIRRCLAQCRADVMALRAMTYGIVSRLARVPIPGPEGSMVRLYFTQLVQRVQRLAMDVIADGALDLDFKGTEGRDWVRNFLLSFKDTISGGTKDIQRNIIAGRILGLPRR